MAITVVSRTSPLRWSDFSVSPTRIQDNADRTLQDSYTSFNYAFDDKDARTVSGRFSFADPWKLTITPSASVYSGVGRTDALLSHEQFHYDVGVVCARALARELAAVRTRTKAELLPIIQKAIALHFHRRAGLIQSRYDRETAHGTNAAAQRRWKQQMASVLANPNAHMIGGWWL